MLCKWKNCYRLLHRKYKDSYDNWFRKNCRQKLFKAHLQVIFCCFIFYRNWRSITEISSKIFKTEESHGIVRRLKAEGRLWLLLFFLPCKTKYTNEVQIKLTKISPWNHFSLDLLNIFLKSFNWKHLLVLKKHVFCCFWQSYKEEWSLNKE